MSKTGRTKKTIVNMLAKKPLTLSDLSAELGLAPSTVKQHLEELEFMGAIEPIENRFIKKWKYYRVNPGFGSSKEGLSMRNIATYAISGILITAVLLYLLLYHSGSAGALSFSGGNSITVSLTDPPIVPYGTNELIVNYSSVQVNIKAGNSTSWINARGNGSIDLMSLINVSQVIGKAYLNSNATIYNVRFNVSSAYIIINNTEYPVTVPQREIEASINSGGNVSSGDILIDLSPTVAEIYTSNSTIFIMVPSVKAILINNDKYAVSQKIGNKTAVGNEEKIMLSKAESRLALSNMSLSDEGNATVINITVSNEGNKSVKIQHLIIQGDIGARISTGVGSAVGIERSDRNGGDIVIKNLTLGVGGRVESTASRPLIDINVNATGSSQIGIGSESKIGVGNEDIINSSVGHLSIKMNESLNATNHPHFLANQLNASVGGGLMQEEVAAVEMVKFRTINFLVAGNGSLILPGADMKGDEGYLLMPGQSVRLSFDGRLSLGNGRITTYLVNGSDYTVYVGSTDGSSIEENVTAS